MFLEAPTQSPEAKVRLVCAWDALIAACSQIAVGGIFIAGGASGNGVLLIAMNVLAGGAVCLSALAPIDQIEERFANCCGTCSTIFLPVVLFWVSSSNFFGVLKRIQNNLERYPNERPSTFSIPTFREGAFTNISLNGAKGWAWTCFGLSVLSAISYLLLSIIYCCVAQRMQQRAARRRQMVNMGPAPYVQPAAHPEGPYTQEALDRARREGYNAPPPPPPPQYDPRQHPAAIGMPAGQPQAYIVNVRPDGSVPTNPQEWVPVIMPSNAPPNSLPPYGNVGPYPYSNGPYVNANPAGDNAQRPPPGSAPPAAGTVPADAQVIGGVVNPSARGDNSNFSRLRQ